MKGYKIKILNHNITLFSESEGIDESLDTKTPYVCVGPSNEGDLCIKRRHEELDEPLALLSVGAFLHKTRGLPLDEILIKGKEKTHSIFYTGGGAYSITLPKCKLKCANVLEVSGVDLAVYDLLFDGVYRVIGVKDKSPLDERSLSYLVSRDTKQLRCIMAVSVDANSTVSLYGDFSPYPVSHFSVLLVAISFLCEKGVREGSVTFLDTTASFSCFGGEIKLFVPVYASYNK